METLPKELILPPRTVLQSGGALKVVSEAAPFGRRGLLVHGRSLETSGVLEKVLAEDTAAAIVTTWRHPGGEPTLDHLEALRVVARERQADWIAAVGGGSVLDVAKACAGLLRAPLPAVAYHDGAPIPGGGVPFIAVPTTAGTGTEATVVSVLTNVDTGVKKSIRHPSFMARLVILDPDLLHTCPPNVIAWSGMDALTQAVESYVSTGASWLTDALSLRAMRLIAAGLEPVFEGQRGEPERDLLAGSYLAGVALSHARLGLVHGLAHPLGARYHAAHGLVCAACLPYVLDFNSSFIVEKYRRMSEAVDGDLAGRILGLLRALRIESPFKGRELIDLPGIVRETLASGSTAANPRPVESQDVEQLLNRLFGIRVQ